MNKRVKSRFAFIVFVLFVTLNIHSSAAVESNQSPYAEAIKAFENFVIEQMEAEKVPGLSVGFVKDDFIWTKGFGYADLENKMPAKPESSYRMASVSKTFTAIAVLDLVEEGKIDLDAEVQTYVPYFPKKEWPVTVRQLLGHLGGISHYKNYDVEGHIKVHKNTKEALAIFQDFSLVAKPGTRYNYSSYGYNLLGAVIEGASGRSYGDFIKERIFEPLGMENSRMDDPVALIPNRVRGYRIIDGEIKNSEYVDVSSRFAAGGTRSTVVDLLKYAQAISSGKLLKEETRRQMFTSMVLQNQRFTGYGMGWTVRPVKGHFSVGHSGSQPETRTYLLFFPKENFAAALASNRERLDLIPFMRRLIQLILDEDIRSAAYAPDSIRQAVHDACVLTFIYGMSYYSGHERHLSQDERDLKKAFSFFNKYVNEKTLKKSFKETKKIIKDGIHPLSNQAFTRIGSFMAFTLQNTLGKDRLKTYHKKGPLSFFSDYIALSNKKANLKNFPFEKSFSKILSHMERDWEKTYTDYVRRLFITVNTNFDEAGPVLKETFSGAELYADFSLDMSRVSQKLLEKKETEKAFKMLNLNLELYPNSPVPYSSLAFAHIWTGNEEEARNLFKKAQEMDPSHSLVSLNQFYRYGSLLEGAKKMKEALALGTIIAELFPKNPKLLTDLGDMFIKTGQKEKAIKYYKKALEINPKFKRAKKKLEGLQKEAKKGKK
jgi:CubicO group peptidase (beta-lactamase class C family)